MLSEGGGAICLLCKGSSLSLVLTPHPHFHLTHGSSRSHHLTTASPPPRNHLLPHDRPQENAFASSGRAAHQIITVKRQHL